MIARLCGKLVHKSPESIIVDVAGVGYEVFVPMSTFYGLPEVNSTVTLSIHTQVKEDAIQLYGFLTSVEKDAFGLLISVSGVGPKLAKNILSGISVEELAGALGSSDRTRLSAIPGIGAKSAERLILELKDKVAALGKGKTQPHAHPAETLDSMAKDVISALENLGYKNAVSVEAVKKARMNITEPAQFERLFKESLKYLSKK